MKKAFKIIGLLFVLVVGLVIALPFLFKDKIKQMVKTEINNRVNATVDFSDVDISLLRSFPKASVHLKDLSIVNVEPFKGDTLFYAQTIALDMPVNGLFKKDVSEIKINSFLVDNALVNVITNANGVSNTSIAKENASETTSETTPDNNFSFAIQEYAFTHFDINYIDDVAKTKVILTDFNHQGNGNLSEAITTLHTKTTSNISYKSGESTFLDNHKLALNADLKIDQTENKYTFLENELSVNDLKLKFDGYVQILEKATDVDIKFNTPTSDFKNFIALLPKQSQNLNGIQTNGSFTIDGFVKGLVTDTTIPKFEVDIISKNASFKYPDLPKGVEHINLVSTLKNTTGNSDDTLVEIDKLSLQIDQDVFNASGKIAKAFSDNRYIDAKLDGVLNLANLSKAYPVQLDELKKGILTANLQTAFSQHALDTNNFEQMKNNGDFTITDFQYASKDIVNPINIKQATVAFTSKEIKLNSFEAKTGDSDIKASGTIDNLFGFLFSDKKLKGNFDVQSELFKVSDFMVDNTSETENTQKQSETGDALKIPDFLDAKFTAKAKTVVYDNLTLKNVVGNLLIKDETASLQNMKADMFGGKMKIDGSVNTKNEKPAFDMDLGIDKFDISQSFKGMGLLAKLAPIAKILQGKLNTTMKLKGDLTNDFEVNTQTLTGNALAEVLTQKVDAKQSQLLSTLDSKLSFINFDKLNLKDLKTALSFQNGKVVVKPFTVQYDDIAIQVKGAHGFDQTLDYTATFDVPAKYFGDQVGGLLSKLSEEDTKNIKVPVSATILGNMLKPAIKTDVKSAVTNLTKQLVAVQKKKLQQQATDAAGDVIQDVLGDVLGGNSGSPKDSTKTNNPVDPIKDAASDILGGLFGGKKKKKK